METSKEEFLLDIVKTQIDIDPAKIERAKIQAKDLNKSLFQLLEDFGVIKLNKIYQILSEHFDLNFIKANEVDISKEVLNLLPVEAARRYKTIPVSVNSNIIQLAIADPLNLDVLDNVGFILKKPIEAVLSIEQDIMAAIDKNYGVAEETVDNLLDEINEGDVTFIDVGSPGADDEEDDESAPVVKLVSLLIIEAFRLRASDIHIEPLGRKLRVRYRIDGVLHEMTGPPKRLQGSIISRLKIMANLSISEKRLPQDGRIKIKALGKPIDLRVSSLPSVHGESVVLRILDKSNLVLGLSELGFLSDQQKRFEQMIALPNGIILITGPTGSGKTTTLYTCLSHINRPDRKIITVEDPCEYQLSGINQVQVNESIGLNFARVLRSILRQAPNVIMIGEIRDLETAEIAINSALTGHLVFSTLHTNDAPGAVTRLIDQGVKNFLVASSLQGVLAQRLVRSICPHCRTTRAASPYELKSIKLKREDDVPLYYGKGCDECNGTGYLGRKAIVELMVISDDIRMMINKKASSAEIRKRARELGMSTLREDGIVKALSGMTTLEEVFRVAGETEK